MQAIFESSQSEIFINPRYQESEKRKFQKILKDSPFPNHIWIATSSANKWVGLSKDAILASAQAVNSHLNIDSKDIWGNPLPNFHIGGLSIWARAYLSHSEVKEFKEPKWNPFLFYEFLKSHKITITSLVPAQLHDLADFKAPSSLKVIVGGGKLTDTLYLKAQKNGWQIFPTYGLSECASQIATADSGENPQLKILPHMQVQIEKGRFKFRGASLFSSYAYCHSDKVEFFSPIEKGWFLSEDCGEMEGNILKVHGRMDQRIKIGGENVDVSYLEDIFASFNPIEMVLIAIEDERLGYVMVVAISEESKETEKVIQLYNQKVLPFERIRKVFVVPYIPRSPLAKVLKQELLSMIYNKQKNNNDVQDK